MDFQLKMIRPAVVVDMSGRLDKDVTGELEARLGEAVAQGHRQIILRFTGVTYMSSAGIRTILGMSRKFGLKEGELQLVGVKGQVKEVLKMAGLFDLLPIYASVEDALLAH